MICSPYPVASLLKMLQFYAQKFTAIIDEMAASRTIINSVSDDPNEEICVITSLSNLKIKIANMISLLQEMDLKHTLKSAIKLNQEMAVSSIAAGKLEFYLTEIYNRLFDELDDIMLLQIPSNKIRHYEQNELLFGQEIIDKFPSLIKEIQELGKCYALGRYTASCFHSIRCLEAGIRALSRSLAIDDPTKGSDKNWTCLLKKIEEKIKEKWPNAVDKQTPEYMNYQGLYAALCATQNPWRNPTMHLDANYDEEDALFFINVIGGFLRKISSIMDEDGNPKA